jgi:hypothetical protein
LESGELKPFKDLLGSLIDKVYSGNAAAITMPAHGCVNFAPCRAVCNS